MRRRDFITGTTFSLAALTTGQQGIPEKLQGNSQAEEPELWRRHERTGRPLGERAFLDRIERTLGRIVRPAKRGRKPKGQEK
jgi:hypothetical protein